MFTFKREEISSSSNASQSSSDSDHSETSISDIIDLVDKLELNIQNVQKTILPSLQSDLKKLKKKLRKRQPRKSQKKPTAAQTLKNDFKHIPANSKFGYSKGDIVTIQNSLVIDGYTVPDKYKTGEVIDFTNRFVVIEITYKRHRKLHTKPIYRVSNNIQLA